jgi:hypothetical protein
MIGILSHSLSPLSCQQVVSLSQSAYLSLVELTDCMRGGEGVGEESNYTFHEKAWSSMSHSILSAFSTFQDFIGILSEHECMDWNKNITNKKIEVLTTNS